MESVNERGDKDSKKSQSVGSDEMVTAMQGKRDPIMCSRSDIYIRTSVQY